MIMETKYITIPFDLERAKRISSGEEQGKIVTRDGRNVRIVCWDVKFIDPILALLEGKNGIEYAIEYQSSGKRYISEENADDLFISVPEWTTYKDGDIYKTLQGGIAIYNSNYEPEFNFVCPYYVALKRDGLLVFTNKKNGFSPKNETSLSVTEEDKERFISALKLSINPLATEYLKRFFGIEGKNKYELKPFDKVLVRDFTATLWSANIYSHSFKTDEGVFYSCSGHSYKYCIPYNEETKHLLGTTEDWEG